MLLFSISFFVVPKAAHAADLSFTPSSGTVAVGDTISVAVTLKPGSDSVNASDGTITFDNTLLSVSSISKDGSVFSLWTADPTYSNSAGTISYSGGTPTAFSNNGKILTIVFKGKAAGSAVLSFSKATVLAADGKGTDVYGVGSPGKVTVTDAAPAAADTSAADTSGGDQSSGAPDAATPPAPTIISSTFPKQDSWYATTTGIFTWQLQSDTTGVRTLFSINATDTPKVALKPATTTQTLTNLKDGVSYFFVQFKNDFGWGEIGRYKVQIDTVPPTPFDVAVLLPGADGGPPKFTFKTDDALSGMDRYEIILGTSSPTTVNAKDITDGTYPIPPQAGGQVSVTINAFDKAGNVQTATKSLLLPAVAKPKPPASADQTPAPSSGWGVADFLSILFGIIIGVLVGGNIYARKKAAKEKSLLMSAVLEVRDKNDRIFSAMREEFEQMINDYDEKPQLTPQERELLEGIKEVLDISEELVDTSIEDLKKMVRNQ